MKENNHEYEKVINYLYKLIEDGILKIGSKIPTERNLAEELSISRNSTREAIRTLENMGVLESRHGSGNYLTSNMSKKISQMINMMILLKQTDKNEICQFRKNMEKAVCFYIIENKDICGEVIENILKDELNNGIEAEIEMDKQFHYELVKATENNFWIAYMESMIEVYRKWIDVVIRNADDDIKKRLHETHIAIYEGIKNKNKLQCEMAIDIHYNIIDNQI